MNKETVGRGLAHAALVKPDGSFVDERRNPGRFRNAGASERCCRNGDRMASLF